MEKVKTEKRPLLYQLILIEVRKNFLNAFVSTAAEQQAYRYCEMLKEAADLSAEEIKDVIARLEECKRIPDLYEYIQDYLGTLINHFNVVIKVMREVSEDGKEF